MLQLELELGLELELSQWEMADGVLDECDMVMGSLSGPCTVIYRDVSCGLTHQNDRQLASCQLPDSGPR